MKKKTINDPIFEAKIIVYTDCTLLEAKADFGKRFNFDETESSERDIGEVFKATNARVIGIWFARFCIYLTQHECNHAALYILRDMGDTVITENNEEVFVHYAEWIFKQVCKALSAKEKMKVVSKKDQGS